MRGSTRATRWPARFDPDAGEDHRPWRRPRRGARPADRRARRDRRPRPDDEPPIPALARPPAGGPPRPGPDRHARPRSGRRRLGRPSRPSRIGMAGGRPGSRRPSPRRGRLAIERAARGSGSSPTTASGEIVRSVAVDDAAPTVGDRPPSSVAGDAVHVDVAGRIVAFRRRRRRRTSTGRLGRPRPMHRGGGPPSVVAPMPGAILAVHVTTGQAVEAGDPIATLEAMKMEHAVVAPIAGHRGRGPGPRRRPGGARAGARDRRAYAAALRSSQEDARADGRHRRRPNARGATEAAGEHTPLPPRRPRARAAGRSTRSRARERDAARAAAAQRARRGRDSRSPGSRSRSPASSGRWTRRCV